MRALILLTHTGVELDRLRYAIPIAAVALVHVVAIFVQFEPLVAVSQALLMPALAVLLLGPMRTETFAAWWPRVLGFSLLALGASWMGDLLPRFFAADTGFIVLVCAFLVAQIFWITALAARWRESILAPRRVALLIPYVALGALVLWFTMPHAPGIISGMMPLYAIVLVLTAVLATGWGSLGTLGGLLFLVSDGMIALFTFQPALDPGQPWRSFAIMSTYIAAQLLLVVAVRRGSERPATAAANPAGTPRGASASTTPPVR